ncbi:MAG: M24 family metallopeptidase, partial [bacterium]|nr:M24 family metallopeptidase [bacterium]
DAGFGDRFIHRTGHSIGEECHGNAVHIDNLETKDERLLMKGICFSVEPGIYLEGEMAVRSEIDCFITLDGEVVVALVDGSETTLKRFYREPEDKIRLQPANAEMDPILVPADQVQIQGRLLAVLRKYN